MAADGSGTGVHSDRLPRAGRRWAGHRVAVCAALVLLPFAGRVRQAIARRPRLIVDFFAIGVLNSVLSAVFTALALQRASSGVVAVLQTLSRIARIVGRVRGDVTGLLFALAGLVTVSVAAVYVRRNLGGTSALVTASGQITAACLVAEIVAFVVD